MDTRTMLGWFEYLDDPKRELTLSEFMAQMLFHVRQHVASGREIAQQQRDAVEHLEGMVGSLDAYLAEADPRYRQLAEGRGAPSAALPEGRR